MPRTHIVWMVVFVLTSVACGDRPASAQEIRWRHDYSAARREATETGRALLLDFGTDACFWCKKLDATTFRDPKVLQLLHERFIPVKLDGNKEPRLTQALSIDGFPTLIVATPEGKVIGRHSGYADVVQLTALLGKAPAPATPKPAVVPAGTDPEAERWRRAKEQLDADLAALHPKITAALDR